MSFGGRGRGRGRGFPGGGFRATLPPFEPFPEIEGLGTAECSMPNLELIKWTYNLQKYHETSPYYYEDKTERLQKAQKQDIEKFSTRNLKAANDRPPLVDFIKLDKDHMPAELAQDRKRAKRPRTQVRWNSDAGLQKLDVLEKMEKFQSQREEGTEKKENEEGEEEEDEEIEEDGEFSDEGDYEQAEYCDDDEDDFNMVDDGNDNEELL